MNKQQQRDLIKCSLWIACLYGFALHILYSVQQMLQFNVFSTVEMTDNTKIPAPSLSICPFPPWSINKLVDSGLNTSCIDTFQCLVENLHHLPGYWSPERGFDVASVAWDPEEVIDSVEILGETFNSSDVYWEVSWLTTMVCFTLHPHKLITNVGNEVTRINFKADIILPPCYDLHFSACEEVEISCGISCANRIKYFAADNGYYNYYVLIHSEEEVPLTGSIQPVIWVQKDYSRNIHIEYEEINKISSDTYYCTDVDFYQTCMRHCLSKEIIENSNCSKSFTGSEFICNTVEDFRYIWEQERALLDQEKFQLIVNCKCDLPCQQKQYFSTGSDTDMSSDGFSVTVRVSSRNVWKVSEFKAYPTSSFLADFGGAAGLWLGISGLSASLTVLKYIFNIAVR